MNRLSWLVLGLIALVFVFAGALIWAMTQPRFATPITVWVVELTTGREATLESARLRLFPLGYELRTLEIDGEVAPYRLETLDTRVNAIGVLPGRPLIAEARIANGQAGIELKGEDRGEGGGFLDYLDEIVHAEIENFVFILSKDGETEEFTLNTATGRPASGEFEAAGQGGGATVFFKGRAAGSTLTDDLRGALTLRGENFADFADLLGLAAPDTPPYELNGELSAGEDVWRLNGISGTVGDSDLAGDFEVQLGRERPLIIADLQSQSLDLDDLGILVGAPSQTSETANALQEEVNAEYAASDRIIPDSTLDLSRLHAVDADVSFQADAINAGPVPLEAFRFDMDLENGVLRFTPLAFEAAQGNLDADIVIDASGDVAQHSIEGAVTDVRLEQIAGGQFARGGLEGRIDLGASGNGFREAAASADGALTMFTRDGQMRALGSEAAGLDLGEVVLLLLTEEAGQPEFDRLNCAVARFELTDGLARTAPVVFDSEDSLIIAEGQVNLDDESVDLRIESDAKDFSWGTLLGDPVVTGTLRNPEIGVEAGESAVQAGIAALLSTVAGPLAALPFFETGGGENADCGALLARAEQSAAQ